MPAKDLTKTIHHARNICRTDWHPSLGKLASYRGTLRWSISTIAVHRTRICRFFVPLVWVWSSDGGAAEAEANRKLTKYTCTPIFQLRAFSSYWNCGRIHQRHSFWTLWVGVHLQHQEISVKRPFCGNAFSF